MNPMEAVLDDMKRAITDPSYPKDSEEDIATPLVRTLIPGESVTNKFMKGEDKMKKILQFAPTLFGAIETMSGKLKRSSTDNPNKSSVGIVGSAVFGYMGFSPAMQNSVADILLTLAAWLQN